MTTRGRPRPVPVLRGPRVTLRPPAPDDADAARRIGVHPEVARGFGEEVGAWRALAPAEAEALVAALAPGPDKVEWVVDAGAGFIGTARLHSFDDEDRAAAYAVGILAPDSLGIGLGTETTRLVLAHAFGELGLHALTVRVLESNSRALACYARCGFSMLRREPDAVVLDGIPRADVVMRLDADAYRRLSPAWGAACAPPAPSPTPSPAGPSPSSR